MGLNETEKKIARQLGLSEQAFEAGKRTLAGSHAAAAPANEEDDDVTNLSDAELDRKLDELQAEKRRRQSTPGGRSRKATKPAHKVKASKPAPRREKRPAAPVSTGRAPAPRWARDAAIAVARGAKFVGPPKGGKAPAGGKR